MVSKSGLDLQRRDRSGPPRNLAPSDFFHVPAKPRQYRNSVPNLATHGKCSHSRRLNRPKSSSVTVHKMRSHVNKVDRIWNFRQALPGLGTIPVAAEWGVGTMPAKENKT